MVSIVEHTRTVVGALVVLLVVGVIAPTDASALGLPDEGGDDQLAGDAEARVDLVIDGQGGTPIVANLFVPASATAEDPAPIIFRTHGFGGTREAPGALTGTTNALLEAGYLVLSWDQRGFGQSGGEVEVLKPELEGEDTRALIDWVVANVPEVQLDDVDDPRLGFSGGSYAGGIQTVTAFLDDRVDAIAPEISWFSLERALLEGGVPNLGWATGLVALGGATATTLGLAPNNPAGPQQGGLAPEVLTAAAELAATASVSDSTAAFFRASSLVGYGADDPSPVDVPTLVMNGSVDTLFDATEGADLYHAVRDAGVPARYVVFCGGHVACPDYYEDAGDRAYLDQAILDWFAAHLRGEDVDTGAPVSYRTNEGVFRDVDDFTPSDAEFVEIAGSGSVVQVLVPQAETVLTNPPMGLEGPPFESQPNSPGPTGFVVEGLAAPEDAPLEIVGIPTVDLEVDGVGGSLHVFVKLVHREQGAVLNSQGFSKRFDLGPTLAQGTIPDHDRYAGLAYTLPPGDHLDLHVSTTSVMHATSRTPAQADVTAAVQVPVRDAPEGLAQPPVEDEPAAPGGDDSLDDGDTPLAAPDDARQLPDTGGGTAVLGLLLAGVAATRLRRHPST